MQVILALDPSRRNKKGKKKRKAADPKFKAKKTKISADSFKKGSATTASVGQKALPPANIKPKTQSYHM